MKSSIFSTLISALLFACAAAIGCRDNTPPPPRVPIPASDRGRMSSREREDARPMPPQPGDAKDYGDDRLARRDSDRDPVKPLPPPHRDEEFQPPFDDAPLVSQRPPEQAAFVEAYRRVGSPRITLFVNRTLEGNIIPVNAREPRRNANGGNPANRNRPNDNRNSPPDYLKRGQYDEVSAKSLDYQAVETIMTDWLAANGQMTIISPTLARQRLTDEQVKELQDGRPTALSEIAQQLGADVLIQVQAHPTRQTENGLEVRIIAEAMNTKGGQSVARAVVDVPPPLEKTTINRYTRFLARKLMDDMVATWSAPPPPQHAGIDGEANDGGALGDQPPLPPIPGTTTDAPGQLPQRSVNGPPPTPNSPPEIPEVPEAPPATNPSDLPPPPPPPPGQ